MRMSRRLGLVGKPSPKYVWEVYDTTYGRDVVKGPDVAGTGAFLTVNDAMSWQVSKNYTATSTQFSLSGPTTVNRWNLQAGYFIASSEASVGSGYNPIYWGTGTTTGTYLYEITQIGTDEFGRLWTYFRRWSVATIQGPTLITTVSSNSFDYPSNGLYEDNWYVLIEGEAEDTDGGVVPTPMTVYAWEVTDAYYTDSTTTITQTIQNSVFEATRQGAMSANFDATTGVYSLVSPTATSMLDGGVGLHMMSISSTNLNATSGSTMYVITKGEPSGSYWNMTFLKHTAVRNVYDKVTSYDRSTYPEAGVQNGYAYLLVFYETQ